MNSAGRRTANRRNGTRRNRRVRTIRPVVMVQPNRAGPRRRTRRRTGRRRANPLLGPTGRSETFTFSVNDLKANSSGVIKFGPDLSECPPVSNGILKSYHRYKITSVAVEYKSHASSTTSGAVFLELDTACKQSTLGSYVNSFTISKSGTKRFSATQINGTDFRETTVNQFYMLYKANGTTTDTAGQFIITIWVQNITPK